MEVGMKAMIKAWWWVPCLVLAFIIGTYGFWKFTEALAAKDRAATRARSNALYRAWCKQYGNPNKLSIDEFFGSRVKVGWLNGTVLPPVGYKKRRSK
jgi:hypothetical protein